MFQASSLRQPAIISRHPHQASRFRIRASAAMCMSLCALLTSGVEEVSSATFRVDDTSLTVPAIHNDDWKAIKAKQVWTRVSGDAIADDPRFIRFLARDYEFRLSDGALRVKTTWFAARKCVSTDELVSSLRSSKRASIEKAVGSLYAISRRLQEKADDGVEGITVIWAHLRTESDVIAAIKDLSQEDQETLAPFTELAKQSFEARIFKVATCKESQDPHAARSAARSGGRRMPSSRSSSRSTRTAGARRGMTRLPLVGVEPGAIPQGANAASPGIVRSDDGDSNTERKKWGFTISMFVARPGSLVFNYAGQFTRCVRASSEAAALALLQRSYRPTVAAAGGKRVSYTVSASASAACDQNGGGKIGGGNLPGNFETPPDSDTLPDEASGGGGIGVEDAAVGGIAPFPDPLSVDPAFTEAGGFPGLDDFDLEAIPTVDGSEDLAGEVPEISTIEPVEP